MVPRIIEFRKSLQALRRLLNAIDGDRVNKTGHRQESEKIASEWFSEICPQLTAAGLGIPVLDRYSGLFRELLRLSSGSGNRKSTYLTTVDAVLKDFRDDFVLPLQTQAPKTQSLIGQFVADLNDPGESEYMKEAIAAAGAGLFRAAAVLGWCAAIDRVHRRIEDLGFTKFNVKSAEMASSTKGRYKKFSSTQSIHSLTEVREVFDTVVLWVIEGMGLIDTNEHARLRGCFELRSQCAHPGNAPVTEYNLLSFFSDINEIIFKNPTFSLARSST